MLRWGPLLQDSRYFLFEYTHFKKLRTKFCDWHDWNWGFQAYCAEYSCNHFVYMHAIFRYLHLAGMKCVTTDGNEKHKKCRKMIVRWWWWCGHISKTIHRCMTWVHFAVCQHPFMTVMVFTWIRIKFSNSVSNNTKLSLIIHAFNGCPSLIFLRRWV